MCPFPSDSFVTSVASASALPLYLAATSLNAGPTFFVSTAWQFRHPLLFASADASSAARAAGATHKLATINNAIELDFTVHLLIGTRTDRAQLSFQPILQRTG